MAGRRWEVGKGTQMEMFREHTTEVARDRHSGQEGLQNGVKAQVAPKQRSTNFTPAMAVLTLCFHLLVGSSGTFRRF